MEKKLINKKDYTKLLKAVETEDLEYSHKFSFEYSLNGCSDTFSCFLAIKVYEGLIDKDFIHLSVSCCKTLYTYECNLSCNQSYEEFYDSLLSEIDYVKGRVAIEYFGETINNQEVVTLVNKPLVERAHIVTSQIIENLDLSGRAQLNIAFLLRTAYEDKLFEQMGFQNIYDYSSCKFGIARGTVSNWIMVATNFGIQNGKTGFYELDKRLKDYSITQLVLLRSLTVEEIEKNGFNSSMSCREIKAKVKDLNLHITKGIDVKNAISEKENDEENDEESDEESDEKKNDCSSEQEKSKTQAKLTFSIKGGTSISESCLAVMNNLILKNSDKNFEIKVFLKNC